MDLPNKKKHYSLLFIICIIVLFCTIIASSTLGTAKIPFYEALCITASKIPLIGRLFVKSNFPKMHSLIVLKLRLPRIMLAGLVGAGLSIVGASFQAIFKNPMADPYVLGVSSGSALGAAIAIVMGLDFTLLGAGMITISAFIFALLTTLVVYNIAKVGNKVPEITLLLSGVAVSFFLSAMMSLIMVFNKNMVDKIVFWLMGSVSTATWKQVLVLTPFVIVGLFIIMAFSRDLNIMLMGDETAGSLGIEVEKVKKILLTVSSIVVAACVSVSGIIGFVGLVIPHIVRLMFGPDHKILLPFSTVIGAIFMIVCDTLARTLASPAEIPVGVITSLFGAPFFIYLLMKSKKKVM